MPTVCEAINACVIIPVYNHARTVGDVVKRALQHSATVLVCDDGSSDGSGQAAKDAGGTLLVHEKNQGKGAALRTLFEEAGKRGFRYAICIDADGQHYPEDLPGFVAAIQRHKDALVIGARDLEKANAPPSSQFGRKFSNFWVWFETGVKVEDSQSGFRAYPLPETLMVMGNRTRYDFEIEVLLKSAWAGVPLASTPIQVLYPKDRVTHFDKLRDNVRISLLNTLTCIRLFVPLPLAPLLRERIRRPGLSLDSIRRWNWLGGPGPIFRTLAALSVALFGGWGLLVSAVLGFGLLPALCALWALAQLQSSQVPLPEVWICVAGAAIGFAEWMTLRQLLRRLPHRDKWDGRSRGGVLGHLIMIGLVKFFGRRLAYLVLYPVVLYFMFFAPLQRQASIDFLNRVLGPATSSWEAFKRGYRHILSFARTLVDRLILGARGKDAFVYEEHGVEHILDASGSASGSVLVTAHLGSWEISTGGLGGRLKAPMSVVAYPGEGAAIRRAVESSSSKFKPNVLVVGVGELAALDILRALREGQMVALQGDRTVDERTVAVDFFGSPAHFPVGPWMLAAMAKAPVIATFNFQTGSGVYTLYAFPPMKVEFQRGRSRDEQLKEWVGDYAKKLESLVRQYPYQWFNFFDFWAPKGITVLQTGEAQRAVKQERGSLG